MLRDVHDDISGRETLTGAITWSAARPSASDAPLRLVYAWMRRAGYQTDREDLAVVCAAALDVDRPAASAQLVDDELVDVELVTALCGGHAMWEHDGEDLVGVFEEPVKGELRAW